MAAGINLDESRPSPLLEKEAAAEDPPLFFPPLWLQRRGKGRIENLYTKQVPDSDTCGGQPPQLSSSMSCEKKQLGPP